MKSSSVLTIVFVVVSAIGALFYSMPSCDAQPPGGPPGMMFMGQGGGPGGGRGGRDGGGGGGPWGGGGGQWGGGGGQWGGGGGFDPSQFISRMDTNGNGTLDPEEAQGPSRMMLERMARDNPKIDLSKPIPMSVITDAFQRMRGQGGPGGGPDGGGGGTEESLESHRTTLVPGFGIKVERTSLPGFGAMGEQNLIKVEERDLKDASDGMRRFDKNNDGGLDENELKDTRWTDSPMQWDRNRDGKLSKSELASRFARRRQLKSEQDASKKSGADDKRGRDKGKDDDDKDKKDKSNPYEKSSFRTVDSNGKTPRPSGLPEWFTRDDINNDNQVSMNEFGRKWNEDTLEEFRKFDANADGFITSKECIAGTKKGFLKGGAAASTSKSTDSDSASSDSASKDTKPAGSSEKANINATMDDRMRKFAEGALKKADRDGNGFISPDEWKITKTKFDEVDTNKDGRIDVNEFAVFKSSSK